MSTIKVTKRQLLEFDENGFVIIRQLITLNQATPLINDVNCVLRGEINLQSFGNVKRVAGKVSQFANPSQHIPGWQKHTYFQRALDVANQLIDKPLVYHYDQLIVKPANYPAETHWHQDAAYWQKSGGSNDAVTCWLALSDARKENGGMQFIPGSHRGPIQPHQDVSHRSEINGAREAKVPLRKASSVTLEVGDATFHHCRTLHYTGGNFTTLPRYGLITHYFPPS